MMGMRRSFLGLALIVSLLFSLLTHNAHAGASVSVEECKFRSDRQPPVSLLFPRPTERLAGKNPIRIVIIPFVFSDSPELKRTPSIEEDYVKRIIDEYKVLSKGRDDLKLQYSKETLRIDITLQDYYDLVRSSSRIIQSGRHEPPTYELVRKLYALAGKEIDLAPYDAAIFEGPGNPEFVYTFEAMLVDKNGINPNLRAFPAGDRLFYNATLHIPQASVDTALHEIMHMFGLVDLYGDMNPLLTPFEWSLMANQLTSKLLLYEKWILGWIPDERVTCHDVRKNFPTSPVVHELKSNNPDGVSGLVLKTSETQGVVIEIHDQFGGTGMLVSEFSPTTESARSVKQSLSLALVGSTTIGRIANAFGFEVMILEVGAQSVKVAYWPEALKNSASVQELKKVAAGSYVQSNSRILNKNNSNGQERIQIKCRNKTSNKIRSYSKGKCPKGFVRA
jgi:hypothetical protein